MDFGCAANSPLLGSKGYDILWMALCVRDVRRDGHAWGPGVKAMPEDVCVAKLYRQPRK